MAKIPMKQNLDSKVISEITKGLINGKDPADMLAQATQNVRDILIDYFKNAEFAYENNSQGSVLAVEHPDYYTKYYPTPIGNNSTHDIYGKLDANKDLIVEGSISKIIPTHIKVTAGKGPNNKYIFKTGEFDITYQGVTIKYKYP